MKELVDSIIQKTIQGKFKGLHGAAELADYISALTAIILKEHTEAIEKKLGCDIETAVLRLELYENPFE